jgi:tetratricopeptide (TPR) repeat protein
MSLRTEQIRERIAQAERDLDELIEQVEQGEIDDATAERLRARYVGEKEELLRQLAGEAEPADEAAESFVTGRRLAGAAVLAIAAAVFTIAVVNTVGGTEGAEGVASDVASGTGESLDNVSNEEMEAVVAANPDIVPMRLALADRYFAAGEFSDALTHYMYVLDTLEVQDPSALANVGWMTYRSGLPDAAETFVLRSLDIQPDGGIAFWYLANIRFVGLGDAVGAVEPLRRLLEYDNLPTELREEAERLLSEVEASL